MHPTSGVSPSQSEGDVNHSERRAQWQREHLDTDTRELLARDSAAFLHQSVSTPCLNAIRRYWHSPVHARQSAALRSRF